MVIVASLQNRRGASVLLAWGTSNLNLLAGTRGFSYGFAQATISYLLGSAKMARYWIFTIAFALVFYGTGASFVESFVNYSSWPLIGEREFIAYHRFISPRVIVFLVAPLILGTVFTILLLWRRPNAIPGWAVWAAISAQTVAWISTAAIQVPIQIQLSAHGQSIELIQRLIETNFWLRRVPYAFCAGLFLWMAARTFAAGDQKRAESPSLRPR